MVLTARRTLADILRTHARARGDVLGFADGDTELTWREVDARVNRAANALRMRRLPDPKPSTAVEGTFLG